MEKQEAFDLVLGMLGSMRGVEFSPPQSPRPSESLLKWLRAWFKKDEHLASGWAFTPLMWLPRGQWASVATALKGEGGYNAQNDADLRFSVTLKALAPVEILVGEGQIKYGQRIQNLGGDVSQIMDPGLYHRSKRYKTLRPGEEVTLAPHWAIVNLMSYSPLGYEPEYWDKSSIPTKEFLREVGYEYQDLDDDGNGIMIRAPISKKKR